MADPDSSHKPGDKRPADSKTEEKRPPKVRRFDMKTRVPRAPKSDTASSADSQNEEDKDSASNREKCVVVTAVVTKSEGSRTVAENTSLPAAEKLVKSAEISQRLESTAETARDGIKHDDSEKVDNHIPFIQDPAPDTMSVNRMFQTSLELQQAEKEGRKEERGPSGHHRNIVDQLFQDFVTTKMREVDDRAKSLPGEESTSSGTEMDGEKGQVSVSMEISRLLDAEITSIKSRSVVPGLTADDVLTSGNDSDKAQVDSHSQNVNNPQNIAAPTDWDNVVAESASPEPAHFSAQSLSMADVFTDAAETAVMGSAGSGSQEMSGAEVKGGLLVRKKPEVKKLGLSIGAESLARIMGSWKNGHILEDGEVASSTDSDGDKAFRAGRKAIEVASDNSDEVSGTGSLSDSDKGKDGKAKKKKKHKHKHKKKKKHKAQSREKEEGEEEEHSTTHSTERKSKEKKGKKASRDKSDRKSSKERKEKEDASEDAKESRSKDKDRKKSAHHSTKTDELFDPWDARNYREDALNRSRSRSPHSSKSKHRDHSKEGHGEPSKDRPRERSKERHHRKHKSRSKERSRKRSHSKEKDKSSKDNEKEQSDLRLKIDKEKLRKIAISRALANMEKGKGPSVDLTTIKSGGKSVAELTEFCKRISQKETLNDSSDSSVSEQEKSEGEDGAFHHPFIMRDPSTNPIIVNIRNAKQLPVLTPQEKQTQAATLRTQFPVSSGTQHRNKESEWVPVTTTTTTTTTNTNTATTHTAQATSSTTAAAAAAAAAAAVATLSASTMSTTVATPIAAPTASGVGAGVGLGGGVPAVLPAPPPPAPVPAPAGDSVFPAAQDINIGAIITERIQAMRRLEQNPYDMQALSSVHKVNEQANAWAQSKHLPGQFTGTTDVRILTQEELAGPDKRNQAWVKKDQFRRAPPLQGGIGMFLLQKMGWKPGDGLGKDNEGNKEPLMLDVKMDRKGLTTSLDHRPNQPMLRPPHPGAGPPGFGPPPGAPYGAPRGPLPPGAPPVPPRAKDLSGKHPVSALTELCTKRRWGAPAFDLINETGPAHKKMFLFKVRVNGVEYMPSASCGNKKLAKAQAAAVCLQEMGLIPRDFVVQV